MSFEEKRILAEKLEILVSQFCYQTLKKMQKIKTFPYFLFFSLHLIRALRIFSQIKWDPSLVYREIDP